MALDTEFWICPCCGSGFFGQAAGSTLCPDCEDFMPAVAITGDSPFCPCCGSPDVTTPGFGAAGTARMCARCGAAWREVIPDAS